MEYYTFRNKRSCSQTFIKTYKKTPFQESLFWWSYNFIEKRLAYEFSIIFSKPIHRLLANGSFWNHKHESMEIMHSLYKLFLSTSKMAGGGGKRRLMVFYEKKTKKTLWRRCFTVNFEKFLRTPFYTTPPDDCFYIDKKKLLFILSLWTDYSGIFLTFQCNIGCIPKSVCLWHAKKDIIYAWIVHRWIVYCELAQPIFIDSITYRLIFIIVNEQNQLSTASDGKNVCP